MVTVKNNELKSCESLDSELYSVFISVNYLGSQVTHLYHGNHHLFLPSAFF